MLDSDPALRWQVERDLLHAPADIWQATRARVATEGFGAALLARQDPDGQWAGGAFFPHDMTDGEDQPWTATTWSLRALREWGVDAAALGDTADRIAANVRWEYEDLPYWDGEVDCCINAFTLASGAWLGVDVSGIATWFVDHQMDEGGWNCEWVEGSTRASFPATLNSLVGILDYEQRTGGTEALRAARLAGQEYLLKRRLLYRLSDGQPFSETSTRLVYPFRAFYTTLHALDYFRAASIHDGVPPDPRLSDAVTSLVASRDADGTWHAARRHPGRVWFEVDVPGGRPSPWLTFHALRVLEWWG